MRVFVTSLLILALSCIPPVFAAGDYSIQYMSEEDAATSPPFSIDGATEIDGGLRLFISTGDPEAVAALLSDGALETQLSDHQARTATSVSLYFGKAVKCTDPGPTVYLDYSDPLPSCGGKPPVSVDYYFEVPVTLGSGRDLAIGHDPDYLWLIEQI